MSTDRELLESAAKAAGVVGEYESWTAQGFNEGIRQVLNGAKCHRPWNPIKDDGDAFRLAVALKIDISWDAFQDADVMTSHDDQWWTAPYGEDRAASLRLAIVRAAAAIAQEPPCP